MHLINTSRLIREICKCRKQILVPRTNQERIIGNDIYSIERSDTWLIVTIPFIIHQNNLVPH